MGVYHTGELLTDTTVASGLVGIPCIFILSRPHKCLIYRPWWTSDVARNAWGEGEAQEERMSRFKVQRMIGFLVVLALLGAPWLTYAQQQAPANGAGSAKATFAGGCFWCM